MQLGVTDPPERQSIPVGCDICDLTGYKGRIGIYEMLVLDDELRAAVRGGSRNDEVRGVARQHGMKLMQDYALRRVCEGLTTIDEALRVVPFEPVRATGCPSCKHELSAAYIFCPYCGVRIAASEQEHDHSLVEQGS